MEKTNQISCYAMSVGALFEVVARATADTSNGTPQTQVAEEIAPLLKKHIGAIRYYAEQYFGCKTKRSDIQPFGIAKGKEIEMLFDISGNLLTIASDEIRAFCDGWNDHSETKLAIVQANLEYIEKLMEVIQCSTN